MEWIAAQEGIEADAEALGVLAQAGEGSVRDSLSALDQAIACCGTKLDAAEVRGAAGHVLARSLGAGGAGAGRRRFASGCWKWWPSWKRTAAACSISARELARYFRNLLVVKISKGATRLVAASPAEQERMLGETAAQFSEEDLTRYLQLALDLFRDLQSSLQPRLHLEMGLLRLVHAGTVAADRRSAGVARRHRRAGRRPAPSKPAGGPPPRPVSTVIAEAPAQTSGASSAAGAQCTICATRSARGADRRRSRCNLADALEHSELVESATELVFTTPKMYHDVPERPAFEAAVQRGAGQAGQDHHQGRGDVASGMSPVAPSVAALQQSRTKPPSARWRIRKCNDSRNCFPTARSERCGI